MRNDHLEMVLYIGKRVYSRIQKHVYTTRWGLTGHLCRGWVTQPLRSLPRVQIITDFTINPKQRSFIMRQDDLNLEIYKWAHEILQIAKRGAKKAQEENRRKGIPNVYDINGHLYYELPNRELTKEDPMQSVEDPDI